ncbi:TIGR04222 domain-containing membrane protein [Sinosporangium siamense]|uniref:TIGR04222 domain-containing membrane protein n=1 Tax=Sinosporangium siamense TaxID=1367973 RepID=A0A919RGH5_9ACTN|nr:TIGR04222 domain-containing membrane protein [Sinosporangium siamense]GII93188.1 hypothetical protein Ssi02_34190 [Sinosporangium siamense]
MEFGLLVGAAATAIYTGTSANRLTAEHARAREVAASLHRDDLSTLELAYLAGGPRRVINTALAGMTAAEAVRIARGGLVTVVSGVSQPSEPVERDILAALNGAGGSMQLGALRRQVASGEALSAMRDRLSGNGLVIATAALGKMRRRATGLKIASVVSIVFAVASLIAEITFVHPQLTATAAVIVAAVAGVGGFAMLRRHNQALSDVLSGPGREVVMSAKRLHAPGVHHTADADTKASAKADAKAGDEDSEDDGDTKRPKRRVHPAGIAAAAMLPIALYGMNEVEDPELREQLAAPDSVSSGAVVTGACGGGSDSGADMGHWGGSDGSGSSSGGGDGGGGDGGSSSSSGGSGCGGGGCGGG